MQTKIIILLGLLSMVFVFIYAQVPDYSIGVPRTMVQSTYYDYMNGGYYDLPAAVQTPEQGGSVFMAFHAKAFFQDNRRVYYIVMDNAGTLELVHQMGFFNRPQGHCSLALDPLSGKPIFAWHEPIQGNPINFTEVAAWYADPDLIYPQGDPYVIIDNPVNIGGYEYNQFIWPTVTIGESPLPDKRRAYIMGRNSASPISGFSAGNPLIMIADFNSNDLLNYNALNWTQTSIAELDDWNLGGTNKFTGSLIAGEQGKLYLIGNHSEYNQNNDTSTFYQTVFINDDYGSGLWRRISVPSAQQPSQVTDPDTQDYNNMIFSLCNCRNFNPVIDNLHRIHYPQLVTAYTPDNAYYPNLFSLRDVQFNTISESFCINDLFPQGATPHSDPCYTPWDVNEDGLIDAWDNGVPSFQTYFPFPYWDETAHDYSMMYNYNFMKMTYPNAQGIMAAVWQDSRVARDENSPNPVFPGPETYISISANNGTDWMTPIVLNPLLSNDIAETMMWVYPASRVINMGTDNFGNNVVRLFLLYLSDSVWGSGALTNPIPNDPNSYGYIEYMALDIHVPVTANSEQINPVQSVSLTNHPNPFSSSTTITCQLAKKGFSTLEIYNLRGQKVKTLLHSDAKSSRQQLVWFGDDNSGHKLPSGVYFLRLKTDTRVITRKVLLIK